MGSRGRIEGVIVGKRGEKGAEKIFIVGADLFPGLRKNRNLTTEGTENTEIFSFFQFPIRKLRSENL